MRRRAMRWIASLLGIGLVGLGGCAPLPLAWQGPAVLPLGSQGSAVLPLARFDAASARLRVHAASGRLRELALPVRAESIQLDARPVLAWPSFLDEPHAAFARLRGGHDTPAPGLVSRPTDAGVDGRLAAASLDSPGRWW